MFFVIIWFLLLLVASCQGQQPVPQPPVTETLSVHVVEEDIGPKIINIVPMEGERLALLPSIQIVFDRDMDPDKTSGAWTLRNLDNKPVSGKTAWQDAKTFIFRPDTKLEPSSTYIGVFSIAATARDGPALQNEIALEFKTTEVLAVSQVFPMNDAQDVDGTTSITVIFNRPVAPLLIQEERAGLPQPLEFSPKVTGQGEWLNSSVYVFQPDEPFLGGSKYTVRVDAGLEDVSGNTLEKTFVWHFSTRAPSITNLALKNGSWNLGESAENVLLDQAFEVYFSQPMDRDSLVKAVSVVNRESGKPFPIRQKWNDDFTLLTIEPVGRYEPGGFYELNIANSAQALDGGALQKGRSTKFSTVPLPRIISISPNPDAESEDFQSWFSVKFASPMKFDSMKDKVRISPEPKGELAMYYYEGSWELNFYGLEPATEYIVRLLPGMADIYGNTIKDEYSFSLRTSDMKPYARLVLPWTPLVYRAEGEQEIFFEHINLDASTVSLYELSFTEFSEMLGDDLQTTQFEPHRQPLKLWDVTSTNSPNVLQRENFVLKNAEGNPLKPGYYLIGVQSESLEYENNFYQGFLFIVATDNITFKATPTEALAWVTDLESGNPQMDLPVIFYNREFEEVGWGLTDDDGVAYLDELDFPAYARVAGKGRLAFTALDWGSGVSAGSFGLAQNYYGNTISNFVYIYTDRPLYRPDQEVQFKGIVRQNDDLSYSLPTWPQVYVTIERSGEKVYTKYLPLTEQGSFSGTFKIAEDAALGMYNISVRHMPGDEFAFGNLSFRVAEYHKPEFQVSSTAKPDSALAGETITFTLDAAYYSGGNVANANVNWYLETEPYYFEPSSDYRQFNFTDWDRDTYNSAQQIGSSGRLIEGQDVTDANGHLEVAQSIASAGNKASQRVLFIANVTDVAGNLVSGSTSVTMHQSEVYAGIKSERYLGKQGEEQSFEIVVLDWESNPVPGQSVTVQFLERRWFSVQEQDSQGTLRWVTSVKEIPVGRNTAITGEDGLASVSFIPPTGGVQGNCHRSRYKGKQSSIFSLCLGGK
jgi:hypothetical protein